jgi:hypothetical protein
MANMLGYSINGHHIRYFRGSFKNFPLEKATPSAKYVFKKRLLQQNPSLKFAIQEWLDSKNDLATAITATTLRSPAPSRDSGQIVLAPGLSFNTGIPGALSSHEMHSTGGVTNPQIIVSIENATDHFLFLLRLGATYISMTGKAGPKNVGISSQHHPIKSRR